MCCEFEGLEKYAKVRYSDVCLIQNVYLILKLGWHTFSEKIILVFSVKYCIKQL